MTEYIEIICKDSADPFAAVEAMKKHKNIKSNVVDHKKVRLRFNASRITSTEVVKLFNQALKTKPKQTEAA